MKKNVLFTVLALFSTLLISTAQVPGRYFIQFRDKGNNPYSLSNPSAYLSPRAIARRAAQNIPIDSLDLPLTPSYVAGVAATGAVIHTELKWFNGVIIFTNDTNVLNLVYALPYVVNHTAVGARQANVQHNKFSDETFSDVAQQNFRNGDVQAQSLNYGGAFNQISMLGGICLHNAGFRGAGMQIAVIDAGFNNANAMSAFDTLFINNRILGTWDFSSNNTNVYDDDVHGMMVLSTMGGNLPGQIVGTAPDASYWLLRSEEAATEYVVEEYYWDAAAEYADSVGADVINSSLGYTQFDDPSENHTYFDMDGHTTPCARAVNIAARKGIAVVVSAGNSGNSPWHFIGTPADADSALAIAAVDWQGNISSFSSRGPSADGDVKPNTAAQGEGACLADPAGGFTFGNGTSFSSPITAGLVACLWQAHPTLTNMQILSAIEQSASQASNPDTLMGYGIPDFCSANLILNGIQQMNNTDQLYAMGPNPFADEIYFSFFSTTSQQLDISLYDAQGKTVAFKKANATGNSVNRFAVNDLGNVAPGIYFMRVQGDAFVKTYKVVKGK